MGDSVGPHALTAESSKVAGATLEDAKEGVAECTFVETSKPADATWEGAMKGTECTLVEKSKAADCAESEGSVGPLNEDSASLRNSRDGAGPLNEDSIREVERVPCAGTATLKGAMKNVAECTLEQHEASSHSQLQRGRQRGVELT